MPFGKIKNDGTRIEGIFKETADEIIIEIEGIDDVIFCKKRNIVFIGLEKKYAEPIENDNEDKIINWNGFAYIDIFWLIRFEVRKNNFETALLIAQRRSDILKSIIDYLLNKIEKDKVV